MSQGNIATPSTPLHPNPDSEVNLKAIASAAPENLNLDLNSDMSDDDDGIQFEEVNIASNQKANAHFNGQPNPVLESLKREDMYGGLMSSASVTSLRELNDVKQFATTEELDDGGFSDVESPKYSPINPFRDSSDRVKETRRNVGADSSNLSETGRLSLAQQSRFVQYIDNRLLQIQRRFIKSLSSEDNFEKNEPLVNVPDLSFTLVDLLSELSSVLDFIWYSIFETKTIQVISNKQLSRDIAEPAIVHPSRLFGQTSYLIKIMGDLADYITKYNFEQWHDLTDLLQLLKKIDSFVSILIDKTEQNNITFIDNTERVRIDSIITRTKHIIIEKFEHMKFKFISGSDAQAGSKRPYNHSAENSVEEILSKYEEKIGEVYEGIIDRTSI